MNQKNIITTLLIIILLFSLNACNNTSVNSKSEKINIAVSIVPQKTFVKAVGGKLVEVVTLIPSGNSPANYQPSFKQMSQLSDSSVYFSIGVPTENANILPKLKDFNNNIKIVSLDKEVGKVYPYRYINDTSNNFKMKDPHIWMSPKRVRVMIRVIKEELIELDPQHKFFYENNARAYINKLNKLDNRIKETLKDVKKQSFIIYHPVLGYFAQDYGLNMITIEQKGKEATAKRIQKIINFAQKKDIKFIFYQKEFDDEQAKTIANEINGTTVQISPLSSDYIKNYQKICDIFDRVLK